MSCITDVLIVARGGEGEALASVNAWLTVNDPRKQHLDEISTDGAGGGKVSSMALYAAAFNYVDLWGLLDAIRAAPWRIPSTVVVYVDDESGLTQVMSPAREDTWTLADGI